MMLWQLARRRRQNRRAAGPLDLMEQSLQQTAGNESLLLIDAAMRHLRAVTVGQSRPKPEVLAVRTGAYGFEVLLGQPTPTPPGWRAASGGHVLELPQGVTAHDLGAVGRGPSLCPALVPVGTTFEGPLLLNLEQLGCLSISGPGGVAASLLGAITATLALSPMASDMHITAVGLDAAAGVVGWEHVNFARYDSPYFDELAAAATAGRSGSPLGTLEIVVIGPGNDLLIQRVGQLAATPGTGVALVGATSAVGSRWPWSIHVDDAATAVVHPISIAMTAAQALPPEVLRQMAAADTGAFESFGPQ